MAYNDGSMSTIERAFELARGGECLTVKEIRFRLAKERYPGVDESTAGPTIQAQLKAAIEKARVKA
jgi:hypothetical protein